LLSHYPGSESRQKSVNDKQREFTDHGEPSEFEKTLAERPIRKPEWEAEIAIHEDHHGFGAW
jgi:hypothetical protein